MSTPALVLFGAIDVPVSRSLPPAERVIAGHPLQSVRNQYSDESGRFHAGEWACEVGAWHVVYTESEFCQLLEGSVRITDEAGVAHTLKAGDAFVIPAGFRGTWETLERCRKHYAIFE